MLIWQVRYSSIVSCSLLWLAVVIAVVAQNGEQLHSASIRGGALVLGLTNQTDLDSRYDYNAFG